MSSPWPSARASLDGSFAVLREIVEELKAAKSVDIGEVAEQLAVAAESARDLRALVSAELPEAAWHNREELDALLETIRKRKEERAIEQLRSPLLALATVLERGTIVHRRAVRVEQVNRLRDQAIQELRSQAAPGETPPILPGPGAEQWIEWACDLKDPEDAESLQSLRNGFAHLDEFVANLTTDMWIAAGSPGLEAPNPTTSAEKTHQQHSRPDTHGPEPVVASGPIPIRSNAATSGGPSEPPVTHSVNRPSPEVIGSPTLTPRDVTQPKAETVVQRKPVQSIARPASTLGLETEPVADSNDRAVPPSMAEESSAESAITYDSSTGSQEHWGEKWRMVLAIAGVLVLALAVLATVQWRSHRNHISPVEATGKKIEPPPLLHRQPVEGAQDKILLTIERCERMNTQGIECWGYVSNFRDQSSEVSLFRADVVDGKGKSFTLSSNGQFDFSTGPSLGIPAGSSVKYTVKIPDESLDARTLTLYLDVSKPRTLEYTFRDVPVAD